MGTSPYPALEYFHTPVWRDLLLASGPTGTCPASARSRAPSTGGGEHGQARSHYDIPSTVLSPSPPVHSTPLPKCTREDSTLGATYKVYTPPSPRVSPLPCIRLIKTTLSTPLTLLNSTFPIKAHLNGATPQPPFPIIPPLLGTPPLLTPPPLFPTLLLLTLSSRSVPARSNILGQGT